MRLFIIDTTSVLLNMIILTVNTLSYSLFVSVPCFKVLVMTGFPTTPHNPLDKSLVTILTRTIPIPENSHQEHFQISSVGSCLRGKFHGWELSEVGIFRWKLSGWELCRRVRVTEKIARVEAVQGDCPAMAVLSRVLTSPYPKQYQIKGRRTNQISHNVTYTPKLQGYLMNCLIRIV